MFGDSKKKDVSKITFLTFMILVFFTKIERYKVNLLGSSFFIKIFFLVKFTLKRTLHHNFGKILRNSRLRQIFLLVFTEIEAGNQRVNIESNWSQTLSNYSMSICLRRRYTSNFKCCTNEQRFLVCIHKKRSWSL